MRDTVVGSAGALKRPKSMPMRRFYRIAMILPLVVPIPVMVGAYVFGMPISWPLEQIVFVLIMSEVLGAIPYLLLALWANRWMQGRTENEIRRKALRAPLFMLVAFLALLLLLSGLSGDPLGEGLLVFLYAGPAILILGYAYVGLVFWLRRLVVARGWLELTAE